MADDDGGKLGIRDQRYRNLQLLTGKRRTLAVGTDLKTVSRFWKQSSLCDPFEKSLSCRSSIQGSKDTERSHREACFTRMYPSIVHTLAKEKLWIVCRHLAGRYVPQESILPHMANHDRWERHHFRHGNSHRLQEAGRKPIPAAP